MKIAILFLVCIVTVAEAVDSEERGGFFRLYVVEDDFVAVKEALIESIENQGLVMSKVADVGAMLTRTGKDLGKNDQIYHHATNLEFCSAVYSRKMMSANANNIVNCPFVISVYEFPKRQGVIHVSFRNFLDNQNPQGWEGEIDQFLQKIVRDVVE